MLRFFRNIRQKLLENGSLHKYFWYAIGEVFLVVIGILIALQINNWNEQRKAAEYEITLLSEMQNSLNSDLFLITEYYEPRVQRNKEGVDSLLLYVQKNEMPEIETLSRLFGKMLTNFNYRFDLGPYDNLKSSGLNIIQNDSLRSLITLHYGVTFPAYDEFINDYMDRKYNEAHFYLRKLIKDEIDTDKNGNPYLRGAPTFTAITNPDVLRVINIRSDVYSNSRRRLDAAIDANRELEALISSELKSRGQN